MVSSTSNQQHDKLTLTGNNKTQGINSSSMQQINFENKLKLTDACYIFTMCIGLFSLLEDRRRGKEEIKRRIKKKKI